MWAIALLTIVNFIQIQYLFMRTSFKQAFAYLANSTTVYAAITDFQGNLIAYNHLFTKQFSQENNGLKGAYFGDLFAPEDNPHFQKILRSCMSDVSRNYPLKLHHLSARKEVYTFDCSVLRDEDQIPQGLLLIGYPAAAQTTTPTYEANRTQRLDEATYEAPAMIWMTDHYNQLCFANASYLSFKGATITEEKESNRMQHVWRDDLEKTRQNLDLFMAQRKPFEIRYRVSRKDGSIAWITDKGKPFFDASGNYLGYIGVCNDVTDKIQTHLELGKQMAELEKLKADQEQLNTIVTKIGSGIVLTNTDMEIRWANPGFCSISGYSPKELLGRHFPKLMEGNDTDDNTADTIMDHLKKGINCRTEIAYQNRRGNTIWTDASFEPMYDQKAVLKGYFIVLNDITALKLSEKEVKKQIDHLKKLSFISSHELRHEFAKMLQILYTVKLKEPNIFHYQSALQDIEKAANFINKVIYTLNDEINFATTNNISLSHILQIELEEVVLIDDDPMVNRLNELVLEYAMPGTRIQKFYNTTSAIDYLKENPSIKRSIFLDLNLEKGSGWEFLETYQALNQPWAVMILTSSVDHADIERARQYRCVSQYLTKPLTVAQIEQLQQLRVDKVA
jgi:PAS domain S-box-containing protein